MPKEQRCNSSACTPAMTSGPAYTLFTIGTPNGHKVMTALPSPTTVASLLRCTPRAVPSCATEAEG